MRGRCPTKAMSSYAAFEDLLRHGCNGCRRKRAGPRTPRRPRFARAVAGQGARQRRTAAQAGQAFTFWALGPAEGEARTRVSALAGDVTEPRFGLGEQDFRQLACNSTHIVHSAGAVRMNLPLEEARRSSVGSARNVVALARASQAMGMLQKLEFVSTVGVLGRGSGVLEEKWVTAARQFHNTYEAAKADAEDYIRTEIEAGLPVTVHRPSMVVGDSRSGRIVHFQCSTICAISFRGCARVACTRSSGACGSTRSPQTSSVRPLRGPACRQHVRRDLASELRSGSIDLARPPESVG